jgi:type II secretory pathway pseudopilin PulG
MLFIQKDADVMRFSRTDQFEVVMLIMTALCCSVALVSCGRTAKSRDEQKNQEVALQQKQQADKLRADQAQADTKKANDEALKQRDEEEKRKRAAAAAAAADPNKKGAVNPKGPGAVNAPGAIVPPIGEKKDDKKPGTTPAPGGSTPPTATTPGPKGDTGATGPAGQKGADAPGTIVQGVVAPGTQTTPAPTTGGGATNAIPPIGHEQSGLSSGFESEALNLLDLGGGSATWIGCTVSVATLGQPPASQQAMKETLIVEKSGEFHRYRQLYQGADCATALQNPEPQVDGKIKIVARESGSTADAITYKIDLHIHVLPAPTPATTPPATTPATTTPAPAAAQEPVIQNLIRIERQAGLLYFGKEPEQGQARPTTVDGGYKLKHN